MIGTYILEYKELLLLNNQKINSPIKNGQKHLKRHFSKKYTKSPSFIIREMQIKTAVRYHITLTRMLKQQTKQMKKI